MSRDEGFAVMDISVGIVNDPKVRRLFRERSDAAAPAFVAYVAMLGESWRAGRRVSIEDAWPATLPFVEDVVDALKHVKLIDSKGFISAHAWRSWFVPAHARREASRERWRRTNAKRGADAAMTPRGSNAATEATVPSVPSVPSRTDSVRSDTGERSIPPPPAERGRRSRGTNPRATRTSPRATGENPRATQRSPRQIRADQKRGPTDGFADLLVRAAGTQPEVDRDDDIDPEFVRAQLHAQRNGDGHAQSR